MIHEKNNNRMHMNTQHISDARCARRARMRRPRRATGFKLAAGVIAGLFLIQQIAWSAPPSVFSISVDEKHGRIRQRYKGSDERIVIHVQDAHMNSQAQENLARVIAELIGQIQPQEREVRRWKTEVGGQPADLGVGSTDSGEGSAQVAERPFIGIEGAWETYALEKIQEYPVASARERVGREMIHEGTLIGAEYAQFIADTPFELYGLEDEALFRKDLDAFRQVMQSSRGLEDEVRALEDALADLRAAHFTGELHAFDARAREWEDDRQALLDGLGELYGALDTTDIDLMDYINLLQFKEAYFVQKMVNPTILAKEIELLMKNVRSEEHGAWGVGHGGGTDFRSAGDDELMQLYREYQDDPRQEKVFLKVLFTHAAKRGIVLSEYPHIQRMLTYWNKYALIDTGVLLQEAERASHAARLGLCTTDAERAIVDLGWRLRLVKKLYSLRALKSDVNEFRAGKERYSLRAIRKEIGERLQTEEARGEEHGARGVEDGRTAEFGVLADQDLGERIDEFYRLAEERDSVMVEKLLAEMESRGQRIGVVVAGGYHADGLSALLRDNRISYVSITPAIDETREDLPYVARLSGLLSPLGASGGGLPGSAHVGISQINAPLRALDPALAEQVLAGANLRVRAETFLSNDGRVRDSAELKALAAAIRDNNISGNTLHAAIAAVIERVADSLNEILAEIDADPRDQDQTTDELAERFINRLDEKIALGEIIEELEIDEAADQASLAAYLEDIRAEFYTYLNERRRVRDEGGVTTDEAGETRDEGGRTTQDEGPISFTDMIALLEKSADPRAAEAIELLRDEEETILENIRIIQKKIENETSERLKNNITESEQNLLDVKSFANENIAVLDRRVKSGRSKQLKTLKSQLKLWEFILNYSAETGQDKKTDTEGRETGSGETYGGDEAPAPTADAPAPAPAPTGPTGPTDGSPGDTTPGAPAPSSPMAPDGSPGTPGAPGAPAPTVPVTPPPTPPDGGAPPSAPGAEGAGSAPTGGGAPLSTLPAPEGGSAPPPDGSGAGEPDLAALRDLLGRIAAGERMRALHAAAQRADETRQLAQRANQANTLDAPAVAADTRAAGQRTPAGADTQSLRGENARPAAPTDTSRGGPSAAEAGAQRTAARDQDAREQAAQRATDTAAHEQDQTVVRPEAADTVTADDLSLYSDDSAGMDPGTDSSQHRIAGGMNVPGPSGSITPGSGFVLDSLQPRALVDAFDLSAQAIRATSGSTAGTGEMETLFTALQEARNALDDSVSGKPLDAARLQAIRGQLDSISMPALEQGLTDRSDAGAGLAALASLLEVARAGVAIEGLIEWARTEIAGQGIVSDSAPEAANAELRALSERISRLLEALSEASREIIHSALGSASERVLDDPAARSDIASSLAAILQASLDEARMTRDPALSGSAAVAQILRSSMQTIREAADAELANILSTLEAELFAAFGADAGRTETEEVASGAATAARSQAATEIAAILSDITRGDGLNAADRLRMARALDEARERLGAIDPLTTLLTRLSAQLRSAEASAGARALDDLLALELARGFLGLADHLLGADSKTLFSDIIAAYGTAPTDQSADDTLYTAGGITFSFEQADQSLNARVEEKLGPVAELITRAAYGFGDVPVSRVRIVDTRDDQWREGEIQLSAQALYDFDTQAGVSPFAFVDLESVLGGQGSDIILAYEAMQELGRSESLTDVITRLYGAQFLEYIEGMEFRVPHEDAGAARAAIRQSFEDVSEDEARAIFPADGRIDAEGFREAFLRSLKDEIAIDKERLGSVIDADGRLDTDTLVYMFSSMLKKVLLSAYATGAAQEGIDAEEAFQAAIDDAFALWGNTLDIFVAETESAAREITTAREVLRSFMDMVTNKGLAELDRDGRITEAGGFWGSLYTLYSTMLKSFAELALMDAFRTPGSDGDADALRRMQDMVSEYGALKDHESEDEKERLEVFVFNDTLDPQISKEEIEFVRRTHAERGAEIVLLSEYSDWLARHWDTEKIVYYIGVEQARELAVITREINPDVSIFIGPDKEGIERLMAIFRFDIVRMALRIAYEKKEEIVYVTRPAGIAADAALSTVFPDLSAYPERKREVLETVVTDMIRTLVFRAAA